MFSTMMFYDDLKQVLAWPRRGAKDRLAPRSNVATLENFHHENAALKREIAQLKTRERSLSPLVARLDATELALMAAATEGLARQLDVANAGLQADLNNALDAVALESQTLDAAHATARQLLEQALNIGERQKNRVVVSGQCEDAVVAAYVRVRPHRVLSQLGELVLDDAEYQCAKRTCTERERPRRAALALPDNGLTQGAEKTMALVAASHAFVDAATIVQTLTAMSVNAKRVERTAKRLGERLHADERRRMERP